MKIALCFLISYNHKVNKEKIWIDWLSYNSDIINIYFHYTDKSKITSSWILDHCLPDSYIVKTSYYHVVGAYFSLLKYALVDDNGKNKWFMFLTESCVPIIPPEKFRSLFFRYNNSSIMRWKPAWWNVKFHKRSNLHLLPENLRLGHDPWFVLERNDAISCTEYIKNNYALFNLVNSGGFANESIFAILLKSCGRLDNVINETTTACDWSRMVNTTSPHLFKIGNVNDIEFIINFLRDNHFTMFLRKVDEKFPDDLLLEFVSVDEEKKNNDYIVSVCLYFFITMIIINCIIIYLEIF